MSAQDIMIIQQEKQKTRHASFDKIIDMCYNKIENCVRVLRNSTDVYFDIPEIMIGYPLYDLNECISYVQNVLERKGFMVRYIFPRVLQISWKPPPSPISSRIGLVQNNKKSPTLSRLAVSSNGIGNVPNGANASGTSAGQKTIQTSVKQNRSTGKFIMDLS